MAWRFFIICGSLAKLTPAQPTAMTTDISSCLVIFLGISYFNTKISRPPRRH
jgi:hypothetical protein